MQVASSQGSQIPKQTYVENLPGVQSGAQANVQASAQAQAPAFNAPLPAVRPSLKDAPPSLETALVSPARDSAADAMASVMTPGDKSQGDGQDQQYADLQKYSIPVPQLLGDRLMPGDAQADTVADASVPVPNMRPELKNEAPDLQVASVEPPATIPVTAAPAVAKPEVANALITAPVTAASSTPVDASANVTVAAQTPEAKSDPKAQSDELAKLLKQMADSGELDKLAPPRPMPVPESRPEMVAALTPAQAQQPEIVQPIADASGKSATIAKSAMVQPKKGARPAQADQLAQKPVNGMKAPKLTDKLIARWALSGNRAGTTTLPVKPPEYASVTMTQKPATVYTAGFSTKPVYVDPARFSGSAVSFPAVERFQ